MTIVYYAHLVLQNGTKIEFSGKNYEKVAARLESRKRKIFETTEYWPAGFIQSFR